MFYYTLWWRRRDVKISTFFMNFILCTVFVGVHRVSRPDPFVSTLSVLPELIKQSLHSVQFSKA
jgi:hypothetical protein